MTAEEIISYAVALNDERVGGKEAPIIWTIGNWFKAVEKWFPELDGAFTDGQHIAMMVGANRECERKHHVEYARARADLEGRTDASGKKKHYRRAIRVRRSPETWRHLEHYPGYQISSHGRLRSAQRAEADDVLKPQFKWHYGKAVLAYEIRDKDGARKSRFMDSLMVNAGFLKRPEWGGKDK